MKQDRNFDDLIERFEERIYETGKGYWRLKLLKQDLQFCGSSDEPLSVWDAGCGLAQISHWLAGLGHRLTLCDISEKMLDKARALFAEDNLTGEFHQASAQAMAEKPPQFDLVLFHAVMEWMAHPQQDLIPVLKKVKHSGYLSLLFYNRNAMVYTNVLKGQWRLKPILEDSYLGKGNKLSPPNPQFPNEIKELLIKNDFEIVQHTGIRVFGDYMTEDAKNNSEDKELQLLELKYCRLPTYRDMGRYVHLLARKVK